LATAPLTGELLEGDELETGVELKAAVVTAAAVEVWLVKVVGLAQVELAEV
jgi:hypothetical protein